MQSSQMNEMIAALKAERTAILSGSYETLSSFSDCRERLIGPQSTAEFTASEARLLLDQINRNQRLLSAAIRGVQAALGRIRDIDRAHTSLGTYRKDATRAVEPAKSSRLEQRA